MRRFIPVVLVSLALAVTGCGGSETFGPRSVAGTYTLRTVNNALLPFTTSEDATYKAEILSWVVTLNENNGTGIPTYSHVFQGRSTDNGQVALNTVTSNGTYDVIGCLLGEENCDNSSQVVVLHDQVDNSSLSATVVGSVLTMVIDGPVGVLNLRFTR
jgi:hypothetical protein